MLLSEYRGVDYAAVLRLCSEHMPVLGFREREKRQMKSKKKRKKRTLICPSGSWILLFQIVSVTFRPRLVHSNPPLQRLFTVP